MATEIAPQMTPAVRLATIVRDPLLLDDLVERVCSGATLTQIAKLWEVPATGLRKWLAADENRLALYEQAVEAARLAVDEDWRAALAAIIRADVRRLHDAQGQPLPVTEIPDLEAQAIAGIDVEMHLENEATVMVRKVRLIDRTKALEQWGRHRKLFTDKVDLGMTESVAETLERLRRPGPAAE
jgi:hypothetical protein